MLLALHMLRRKFYDSSINGTSPGAGKALKYIQQIYKKREPGKITRRWLKFDAYIPIKITLW